MFSDVQIIGGQYSYEYEMGGFISKVGESYYYFYIQLRQLSVLKSINFGYNDFELFKEFVNDSNLGSEHVCKTILFSLARQVYFNKSCNFIGVFQSKVKLLNLKGIELNRYLSNYINKLISELNEPLEEFAFNSLMTVLKDASEQSLKMLEY